MELERSLIGLHLLRWIFLDRNILEGNRVDLDWSGVFCCTIEMLNNGTISFSIQLKLQLQILLLQGNLQLASLVLQERTITIVR